MIEICTIKNALAIITNGKLYFTYHRVTVVNFVSSAGYSEIKTDLGFVRHLCSWVSVSLHKVIFLINASDEI